MRYDKLVRDGIPDRIKAKGEPCSFHVADEAEYWEKLKAKLSEEAAEFAQEGSVGEIADVLEVLDAIIAFKGFDRAEIEAEQKGKRDERGGFAGRVILEES